MIVPRICELGMGSLVPAVMDICTMRISPSPEEFSFNRYCASCLPAILIFFFYNCRSNSTTDCEDSAGGKMQPHYNKPPWDCIKNH